MHLSYDQLRSSCNCDCSHHRSGQTCILPNAVPVLCRSAYGNGTEGRSPRCGVQSTVDLSNQLTFTRTTLANIGESQEQPHGPFCRYVQLHRPPDSNNRLTRRLQLYRHRPKLITACGRGTRPCAFAKNDEDEISHDSPMFADACLSSCLVQQGIRSRESSIPGCAGQGISGPHLAAAMPSKACAFSLQRLHQASGTCCDDRHLQSFIKCIHSELSCIHNLSLSDFSSTRSRAPGSRSERASSSQFGTSLSALFSNGSYLNHKTGC